MSTSISEHARRGEISEEATSAAVDEVFAAQSGLETPGRYVQQAIDSATAAKERENQELKFKLQALRDTIDANIGAQVAADNEALQARVRELDADGKAKREAIDCAVAVALQYERRVHDLEEVIKNAKSAFGEHPDTDMDLAERISQLRDENRAWFHKYTKNIQ